jgi:hypothetical protein
LRFMEKVEDIRKQYNYLLDEAANAAEKALAA